MKKVDSDYLFGYMSMADDENAPDGAWWAMLQGAAATCLEVEADSDEAFEAVHHYIRYCASEDGARILGKQKLVVSASEGQTRD